VSLDVYATYTITQNKELALVMRVIPRNKPTPVCLAQHTYWNLAGHNSSRTILDNKVKIWASSYTSVDQHLIPTWAVVLVKRTPYDFNKDATIERKINNVPGGYDINMALDPPKKNPGLRHVVRVKDDFSGRILNLLTTAPGLQFYSSNMLKTTVGKGDAIYGKYSALALETQTFPLRKADAAAPTGDLYNAYKVPEKPEDLNSGEPSKVVCTVVEEKPSLKETQKHVPKEVDDWEDAAEISTNMEQVVSTITNNNSSGGRKYSRDFLLTFREHCNDLPSEFAICQDLIDIMVNRQAVTFHHGEGEPLASTGRALNYSRPDRRGSNIASMDEDKWIKPGDAFA
ncbi:hypothetical protein KI387_037468, partial [Taxus chinensis]